MTFWTKTVPIPPTYTLLSLKGCVLEVNLEYSKELHELHNDYPLVLDKLEITRKILSVYLLQINDDYISTDNVKKLVPNFFDKEKYVLPYQKLGLKTRI